MNLSYEEKQLLLRTARESITSHLQRRTPEIPEVQDNLKVPCGVFVTLHKQGRLRGCIGHITADKPLIETVTEMAVASAFQDPRFPPLLSSELPLIEIELSVMSPLEKIKSPETVIPGTHGVYIRQGYRSGLLLPQVAVEQNWDRNTFLSHTCLKAGLPADFWKTGSPEISVFTATVFHEKNPFNRRR